MTIKQIFTLYLLILLGVGSACNNDPAAAKKPASDSGSVTSDKKEAPSNNNGVASNRETPTPSTGKKHLSIDTSRNENQAVYEKDRSKNIPAPASEITHSKTAGPPGYVTREHAILQTEPITSAEKISTLKKNEIVFILQTIMTDDKGQVTDYPTWYKIERKNKQRGWVIAKSVDAGAGG